MGLEGKVFAVIFLVSATISITMAIPYWMGEITSQYTRLEMIEIISAYCDYKRAYYDFNGTNADSWEINFFTKNTGTKAASIIRVFVQGKPISKYGSGDTTDWIIAFDGSVSGSPIDFENGGRITIEPGSTKKIIILIAEDSDGAYTFARSGVIIEVSLQYGAGSVYRKMLMLV